MSVYLNSLMSFAAFNFLPTQRYPLHFIRRCFFHLLNFCNGKYCCIIGPVRQPQHSTGARISLFFHLVFKICYISVLMIAWHNVWTGSNVYIFANNTHVTLNASKSLVS
jgi:hypothetical protein